MKKNLLLLISLFCFSLSKAQTGSALNFDGVNDYCSRAPLAASQPSNLTLEVRANFTGTSSVNQYMAFNGLNTGTAACGYGLLIFSGQSSLTIHYGGLGVVSTGIPLNTGIWSMYSLVFGTSNTFTLYVNGVSSFTFNSGVNPIAPSTGSFVIGANALGTESFNGSIDDVRLWNRALCASEVSLRANCQLFGNEAGLVANYKFNQGTAAGVNSTVTTLIDSSPNAFNCALNNFSLTSGASNWINPVGTLSTNCSSPAPLTASISPSSNPTICVGAVTTLSVSSGINTFTWSTSSTSVSISVSPSVTTTYSVIGTNTTTGCSGMATTTIVVNPTPTISVNSGAICAGNSFTVVPTGASTYTISGGSSVVTPTSNASYNVTGTSSLGCVSSNTAVSSVTVNALPTVSVSSGVICAGNSFTINASGSANTYSFNSGSSVVSPTANSNYTVTGTNTITSCSNTAISSITVNTLPTISATSNSSLLCTGQTATLTASGANTYTWNTSANTAVIAISPSVTSTYTVNGTDANGCSNVATITQSVSACTGIVALSGVEASLISVYPNPSNGIYTIEVPSTLNVSVIDVLGKIVYNQQLQDGKYTLNLSNLNNGLYILKAENNSIVKTVRLIKE